MTNLSFEWDEGKDQANRKKHGVSFEEAKTAFSDVFGRLMPDPDHSIDEERFILMGMSEKHKLLVICHCERAESLIRIISARRAEKFERSQYEGTSHA